MLAFVRPCHVALAPRTFPRSASSIRTMNHLERRSLVSPALDQNIEDFTLSIDPFGCPRSLQAAGEIRGQREIGGMANIWGRKPIAVLQAEAKEGEFGSVPGEPRLRRTLSLVSLIALGIGCIIGAGIFVLTGNAAAAHAGPAVSLSFILAGVVSTFAGLCYAEMASTVPSRAAPTLMRMRRWVNSSPGSSAGT
jgi:hypothetical protein